MTAPMTPARRQQIEALLLEHPATWETGRALRDLLAEVERLTERLRSLPVLRTCGDCRHWRSGTSFLDEPDTTRCWKVSPPMPIDVDAPPPATCPLRGGDGTDEPVLPSGG